ncbi:hypothetical protein WS62_14325 [Burkholderia sp. ABCPW 14]|nr:hypothetical protein WS62_14325 [Burkholderia sp. ABCPW 14]
MSKRRSRAPRTFAAAPNSSAGSAAPARAEVFTFDDPTPVMNRAEILDYVECWSNGEWFEPPVSFAGLAKSFRASTHHSSALYFNSSALYSRRSSSISNRSQPPAIASSTVTICRHWALCHQ